VIRADTLVETLLLRARAAKVMIATAESCTGGMLGKLITDIPGASDIYERGFITYSNRAKEELLGVHAATLHHHGAVSVETAAEMAAGALHNSHADLAVSTTGVAGPGSHGSKPEGLVCFGLARRGGPTTAGLIEFGARGRNMVRALACDHALDLLIAALPSNA